MRYRFKRTERAAFRVRLHLRKQTERIETHKRDDEDETKWRKEKSSKPVKTDCELTGPTNRAASAPHTQKNQYQFPVVGVCCVHVRRRYQLQVTIARTHTMCNRITLAWFVGFVLCVPGCAAGRCGAGGESAAPLTMSLISIHISQKCEYVG